MFSKAKALDAGLNKNITLIIKICSACCMKSLLTKKFIQQVEKIREDRYLYFSFYISTSYYVSTMFLYWHNIKLDT